jgi:hypothetical protein
MNNTREFTELLKGCRPIKDSNGNIIVQSILNMQIVGLTTDDEYSLDDRFANPLTALKASNNHYGEVTFNNSADKETIVPTQMAVMTKQRAQNHGMTKSGYIGKHTQTTFHDAGCVQGSQGGNFRDTQEFRMLPVTMREMAFDTVGDGRGYDRIYPAIRNLGRQTQSNTGEYLDKYFSKYDKKLEQFIAHFERPQKLIGTIVLIDGEIVAIDKFPSFVYAEQVWDIMIRDCYGALAIISELENKKANALFTKKFNQIKREHGHKENVVDMIETALVKTKKTISNSVEQKIQEILNLEFDVKTDKEGHSSMINGPTSYLLKNEGYVGQVITESEYNHIVSIVKRESFDPNALRKVNELRNKARSQNRFSL